MYVNCDTSSARFKQFILDKNHLEIVSFLSLTTKQTTIITTDWDGIVSIWRLNRLILDLDFKIWKKPITDIKADFLIWCLSQRILDTVFTMSDEIFSTSGYFVIDDNNNNNSTADSDGPDTFMSEAKSYTMYKIGKLTFSFQLINVANRSLCSVVEQMAVVQ